MSDKIKTIEVLAIVTKVERDPYRFGPGKARVSARGYRDGIRLPFATDVPEDQAPDVGDNVIYVMLESGQLVSGPHLVIDDEQPG